MYLRKLLSCCSWYTTVSGVSSMSEQDRQKRIAAVKTADAINAIEGAPVSDYARELSEQWAKGELTDEKMLEALWAAQEKRLARR